jgi:hypothetical protein
MNELKLNIPLLPGPHEFVIMHPFDDVEYAAMLEFCDSMVIDRELILRFPHGSRLFIDGNEAGRLRDIFEEII